jgi:hypothetical protein
MVVVSEDNTELRLTKMDKDIGLFGFVLACVFFKVFFKLVFI